MLGQTRALIAVPATLSPAERAAAEQLRDDRRIDLALRDADAGLPEFLAAGPQLFRRWQTGSGTLVGKVGAAIVSTAIDWRLAGYRAGIPDGLLEQRYVDYLPLALRYSPDRPSFEEGLAWAREPVLGASACLQALSSESFAAHGYLVDRSGKQRVVPEEVWHDVLRRIVPAEGLDVGICALDRGRPEIAAKAFRRTIVTVYDVTFGTSARDYVDAISPELYRLVDDEEAEMWLNPAAEAGNPEAAFEVGRRHYVAGRLIHAERWWKVAAGKQSWDAVHGLGLLRMRAGDAAGAVELWRSAAEAGQVNALYNLGVTLRDAGDLAQARRMWHDGARAGSVDAMHALGSLAHDQRDVAIAERFWLRGALLRHPASAHNLGVLHARRGAFATAEVWWLEAAEAGHAEAMLALGRLKQLQDDLSSALEWYSRAAANGHREAAARLAGIRATAPSQAEKALGSSGGQE